MPFDQSGSIFIAMAVALVVWAGIFVLLWRLDRQARELRSRLDREAPRVEQPAPRVTLEKRNSAADVGIKN